MTEMEAANTDFNLSYVLERANAALCPNVEDEDDSIDKVDRGYAADGLVGEDWDPIEEAADWLMVIEYIMVNF